MLTAVETGATTSILFIVICILLVSPANQPIAVALQLILGRTYTNTLLYVTPHLLDRSTHANLAFQGTTCMLCFCVREYTRP
jgi:hypothetical protein